LLDLISAIYCNVRTRTKVDVTYFFRWYFPVKIIMLVILPKRVICDCESSTTPAVTDRHTLSSNIVFISAVPCQGCQGTTRVKLIITRLTAIADFKQRWRQRGKTVDCSFK